MITKRQAAIISAYTGLAFGNFSDTREYIEELMKKDSSVDPFGFDDSLKSASKQDFLDLPVNEEGGITDREAAIITGVTGICLGDFGVAHLYFEKLLKRSIWTHEMAFGKVWDEIKEAAMPEFLSLSDNVV